jgi:hypothetical protein
MTNSIRVAAATLSIILIASTSGQAADPAVKCESGKLKESSKYAACRLKVDAKAVLKGVPAVYSKCEMKFADKWGKAETKAEGACPTETDKVSMDARITTDAAEIATLLAGGAVTECGDGTVDAGEDCDFGDLNGETCATQGQFGEGLACTPGTCVFDTSGCSATQYEDTGLGTVIDHVTGLEWEQKALDNVNITYGWEDAFAYVHGSSSSSGTPPSGGVQGLGGQADWRLPSHTELQTILLEPYPCGTNPCIDVSVFGPTASSSYWSATTGASFPLIAWFVNFDSGFVNIDGKAGGRHVRAVRGGL